MDDKRKNLCSAGETIVTSLLVHSAGRNYRINTFKENIENTDSSSSMSTWHAVS